VHDAIILARDFHVTYAGAVCKEEENIFRRCGGIGFALRRWGRIRDPLWRQDRECQNQESKPPVRFHGLPSWKKN